jgi:hypothetical protein
MTIENVIEPSTENLLLELKKRALAELITGQDAYEELIDDLLADKAEWGEFNDDDDNVTLRENLLQRWPEVEEYIRKNETEKP